MEIEKLSEKYIKDVAQIEKACFSKPWDEISIAAELKNEFSEFYIAVENGTAVGFVGLYALTGEADIVRVGVLPQYRNRGIAAQFSPKVLKMLTAMFFSMSGKVMSLLYRFTVHLGFMTQVCEKIIIPILRKMLCL